LLLSLIGSSYFLHISFQSITLNISHSTNHLPFLGRLDIGINIALEECPLNLIALTLPFLPIYHFCVTSLFRLDELYKLFSDKNSSDNSLSVVNNTCNSPFSILSSILLCAIILYPKIFIHTRKSQPSNLFTLSILTIVAQ
jgi:hypothetical protein